MKRYAYKGKSRNGQGVQGVLEVADRETAVALLREQGYYVISLKEATKSTRLKALVPAGRLKAKHLAIFCRQFAIMLGTGMSLIRSLQLLEAQSHDMRLRQALEQIRLDVASGSSFTRSLEKHNDLFPQVFTSLVEAGELAGALPEVLERLAIYYEREDELRKKISEALMYPGVITVAAVIMIIVMLFFVLPMVIGNFSQFGIEPPAMTQAVLGARDWLVRWWYAVGFGLLLVAVGTRRYVRTPMGRMQKDTLLLHLPVVGELRKMVIFSRFSRTLGLLLDSGISMIQSLSILGRVVDNSVINQGIEEARLGIERGQGLSAPLRNHKVFPPMVVEMIAVGEETGNLERILVQLSDYYDREVDFAMASFTKLLEPVIMLILAVVVLFLLISVYLPIMEMVTQL